MMQPTFSQLCSAALVLAPALFAQQPAAPAAAEPAKATAPKMEQLAPMTNTLGMHFVPVPGITVLFSEFETRIAEYQQFTKASGYTRSFRPHFEQTEGHPVVGVTRQEAISFCNWLTEDERTKGKLNPNQLYRLPTNEEWSAAAGMGAERQEIVATEDRLSEAMRFVWGTQWPPPEGSGNFQSNEIPGYKDDYPFTAPVGKFKPTPDGVYDLAGNVWEWTWDQKFNATAEGTLRGGSWAYFKRETLVASYVYDKVPADLRAPTVGFRVVYEDRDRTASILAALGSEQRKAEEQKKKEFMAKSNIDPKAVQSVIKRAENTAVASVDVSSLTPVSAGSSFKNSLGMSFVPVEGLKTTLIGVTEVSVGQIDAWSKATGRDPLKQPRYNDSPNNPIVSISWDDAVAFCAWLTERDRKLNLLTGDAHYRLPRDLEWSAAAGLTDETGSDPAQRHLKNTTHFPFGEWPPKPVSTNVDAPNIQGYSDSYSYTAPVGSMRPNAQGIHDLGGNVSEWCEDPWPGADDEHTVRGGSWIMSAQDALLTSARQHVATKLTRQDLGFRCVVDLAP